MRRCGPDDYCDRCLCGPDGPIRNGFFERSDPLWRELLALVSSSGSLPTISDHLTEDEKANIQAAYLKMRRAGMYMDNRYYVPARVEAEEARFLLDRATEQLLRRGLQPQSIYDARKFLAEAVEALPEGRETNPVFR